MSVRDPNGRIAHWANVIGSVLSGVAVLMLSFGLKWIIEIEQRVTRIESNRFTSTMAIDLYEKLNEKADKADNPTPEVRQTLLELKSALQRLENRQIEHLTQHNGD